MAALLINRRYGISTLADLGSNPQGRGKARNPIGTVDMAHGGGYRINCPVSELIESIYVAGAYRVRLHIRRNGIPIREKWSDADGSCVFDYVAYLDHGYYAIAFDHTGPLQNAAIADLITPEPMS